jgi:hypothetical protein
VSGLHDEQIPMNLHHLLSRVALTALVLGLVIQLVPFGRDHSNPPVSGEPAWDSPRTRELTRRACFDCHSNEVHWPWYSRIAPISWLVQHDVDEGRAAVNFSEWSRPQEEASESAEVLREGEMPPRAYLLLHPEARLTADERTMLATGLAATLGESHEGESEEEEDEELIGAR